MSKFENPYNFVPAPPRSGSGPLADASPAGHGRYQPDLWTGRIGVKLTTCTPLLLPDASLMTEQNHHKTYGLRKDADGQPYLPPTSLRGMLRTAFEAITNSRMGILDGHDVPLAYRKPAQDGLKGVPVRVENAADGSLTLRLMTGTSSIGAEGNPQGPMYAAWLGMYGTYRLRGAPSVSHGQKVHAYITRWTHNPPRFDFWNVEELRIAEGPLPDLPGTLAASSWGKAARKNMNGVMAEGKWVEGYVCITGHNIKNKHHERIFFVGNSDEVIPLASDDAKVVVSRWKNLIRDYQACHDDKSLWGRGTEKNSISPEAYIGNDPGETAWSRHIFQDGKPRRDNHQPQPDTADLADGELCYAQLERRQGSWKVKALYPVMISRDLFDLSPAALLDESLKPAKSLVQLSPADRVFGWVKGDGNDKQGAAYKGQLRIGVPACLTDDAIENLGPRGVPLAILGQPKPSQAGFYAAINAEGEALPGGTAKAGGYKAGQGLRGRKVYPHHALAAATPACWDAKATPTVALDAAGTTLYREWRRVEPPPGKDKSSRDSQNRSITEWIRPGAEFSFDIQISNLSDVELGALLWLLQLPGNHFLRLGGGKPLGFGSVRLELDKLDLRNGEAMAADFRDLLGASSTDGRRITSPENGADQRQAFESALEEAVGEDSKKRILGAFLNAAKGSNHPVHYPRPDARPQQEAKNFDWFVANEKNGKRALPPLWSEDRSLECPPPTPPRRY